MTKKEAQEKLIESRERQRRVLCPLLGGDCNSRCISYNEGSVQKHSHKKGEYVCWNAHCSCYAIVGGDE